MYFIIGSIFGCVISFIVFWIRFIKKTEYGEMDVSWDEENKVWHGTMHLDKTIDFSDKEQLILNIKHIHNSRK